MKPTVLRHAEHYFLFILIIMNATGERSFMKYSKQLVKSEELFPNHVNLMALTATATHDTFNVIEKQLSLKDLLVVAGLQNICVKTLQLLEEFAVEIATSLKLQEKIIPKSLFSVIPNIIIKYYTIAVYV